MIAVNSAASLHAFLFIVVVPEFEFFIVVVNRRVLSVSEKGGKENDE